MSPKPRSTARNSQNQSNPEIPVAGFHSSTHIRVVRGTNSTPSNGQIQEPPNACRNNWGRASHMNSTASRGNAPAKTRKRQPMARKGGNPVAQGVLREPEVEKSDH